MAIVKEYVEKIHLQRCLILLQQITQRQATDDIEDTNTYMHKFNLRRIVARI